MLKRMSYGLQLKSETEAEKKAKMFDKFFGHQLAEMLRRGSYAQMGLDRNQFLKGAMNSLKSFAVDEKARVIIFAEDVGEASTVAVLKAMAESFLLNEFPVRQKKKIKAIFDMYVGEKEARNGVP